MDLVLGLFRISKMEEDMDKIVACVQATFLLLMLIPIMLMLMLHCNALRMQIADANNADADANMTDLAS